MFMKDVRKECGLTKKAVEYYEKQGLIHPETGENGYRSYSEREVALLKEISVLRKLGMSIPDIRQILASNHKRALLQKYRQLMEIRQEKLAAHRQAVDMLIEDYDIGKANELLQTNEQQLLTIKEKLLQAFPGTYGIFISLHFGQFLNERIDSPEKEEAYHKVIKYLDGVVLPTELTAFLEDSFPGIEAIERINSGLLNNVENFENYIEDNKDMLENYFKFRASEEFKQSPAFAMQDVLKRFQKSSGYYDVFLLNIKILSASYRRYIEKLEEANQVFMKNFPDVKDLF